MVKVKALRGFGLGGGLFATPGAVLEFSEYDANNWIKKGKATLYTETEIVCEPTTKGGKKK